GGFLLVDKSQAQAVADAAALAGAIDLFDNWGTNNGKDPAHSARNSAENSISDNNPGVTINFLTDTLSYSTNSSTYTAVINIPPLSGKYANQAGYVEVIIVTPQQRFFSTLFGTSSLNATARAVAVGSKAQPGIGLLVLNGSANNALHLSA